MIQGFAYFPSIIYRDEKPEWIQKLSDLTLKYFQKQSDKFPNSSFIQTEDMSSDNEFFFLKNYLLETSREILQQQGYLMNKYDLYVSSLWGQSLNKDSGTNVHIHKNSQISGWFFLNAEINGSYPIYHDTRLNKQMVELDWDENNTKVSIATSWIHFKNMNPGTIMFSNSWIEHGLSVNKSNNTCKSIHFVISHTEKKWNM